jgi:hypothetical protein
MNHSIDIDDHSESTSLLQSHSVSNSSSYYHHTSKSTTDTSSSHTEVSTVDHLVNELVTENSRLAKELEDLKKSATSTVSAFYFQYFMFQLIISIYVCYKE